MEITDRLSKRAIAEQKHKTEAFFGWVDTIVYAVIFVSIILIFFFRFFGVDGESMSPTLHTNDRIVLSCFNYTPARGDVVVTGQPNVINNRLVKRIIAVGGDKIDIDFTNGIVYVNDTAIQEPYIKEPTAVREDFVGPVYIPEGKVFVMGDNRNDSSDSRRNEIGLIDENYIVGKVVYTLKISKIINGIKTILK